jgi:hypothetical protein
MNALINIQNEARIIVERLADKEIARMKDQYNLFEVWMAGEGNAMIGKYDTRVDMYGSVEKYIYMTQYKKWDHELNQYVLPISYPDAYRERREMYYNKNLANMVNELRMMINNWEDKYREAFVGANMAKLNRALAKHIDDNMTASDIRVNIGGDGAEVLANVDGKLFKTFGTLCGGWVQCYHYRYRSSLK